MTDLALVLAMAAVTYATRAAGLAAARLVPRQGRAGAAFDAVPAAMIGAVVAPMALATGWPETAAALVAALAARRLPLIGTVATGTAAVVLLRAL